MISDDLIGERVARIAGGFYLAFILASVLADMLGHIGRGSAQQVYRSIVAKTRVRSVLALVIAFDLGVPVPDGRVGSLRPPATGQQGSSRCSSSCSTPSVSPSSARACSRWSPRCCRGTQPAACRPTRRLSSKGSAYLSINVYKTGFVTAQLFFGTWLFPLGYLVYRSRYLPRFLGVLLLLDGIAVLIWFLQALLLPDYPAIRYPGLVVSFVAEVGLALWLLVKGVKAHTEVT